MHINNAVVNISVYWLSLHCWFFPKDYWILGVHWISRRHRESWLGKSIPVDVAANSHPWLPLRASTGISRAGFGGDSLWGR